MEEYTEQRGIAHYLYIQVLHLQFFLKIYYKKSRKITINFVLSPQILTGNMNTYSEVENRLYPVIIGSKVRVYPYSQYDRTVCLRIELVGCPWNGELKSIFLSFQYVRVSVVAATILDGISMLSFSITSIGTETNTSCEGLRPTGSGN